MTVFTHENLSRIGFFAILLCLIAMKLPNAAFAAVSCGQLSASYSDRIIIDADAGTCGLGSDMPTNGFRLSRYNMAPDWPGVYATVGGPSIFPIEMGWNLSGSPGIYYLSCSGDGCIHQGPSSHGTNANKIYCEGNCRATLRFRSYSQTEFSKVVCDIEAYQGITNASCVATNGIFFQTGDDDSSLSNLTISSGGLSPSFLTATTTYTQTVDHSVNSLTVTPTTAAATASVSVNDADVVSGVASDVISLSVGQNSIPVVVTAIDGSTTTYSLTITRSLAGNQISLSDITKKVDDSAFTITDPSSASSGAFSYTSSDVSVATISGNTATIQGVGSTTITATQASDGTYASATATATLTVSLNDNSISLSDITKQIDDPPSAITDPSSSSSGAFSYSISNSGVATISGNTVTPVGIGSATVTATQAADSTYASASTTFTLTVTENGTSVTSCSDAAARAAHYIATGNSGYCGGSLTKAAAYIYEIWLGDSSTGMTASCRIWTGTLPVMRHQYQAGEKAQGGPIDVKNCSDGTYDTIHLIKSRYLQFAGYASYPAPSGSASHGNTARSTTTFATSNAGHAVLGDWLEDSTGFAASSRPYVRTTSSATSIYKKLAAQPSSSDLASSSDADMYFDEYKRLTASQNNTSSGWLCEGASSQTVCAQILSTDTNRLEWRYTNAASEVSGLPITLSNAKGCSLTIDLSYKSADTSNNQNTGINFLWRNNSGTVEMVGVKPDDGDINISLGKPKC